jgi:hypothetical protein
MRKKRYVYCDKIRGKHYEGCGSDFDFCGMCRSIAKTRSQEELDSLTKGMDNHAEKRL